MNKISSFPDETDIHAYVDGRLDEADRERVEAWLEKHPERAEVIRGWKRDAQALRAGLDSLPAASGPTALDPATIRVRRRQRTRKRLALAAVLVLAIGMGGAGGWRMRGMQSLARPAPMADALQAYRMFVVNGDASLDVTQQHVGQLQSWLEHYFPNAPLLPNLAASGFRPVGGRLLANASGPAALVLYRNAQGNAISFYIRSPAPHADTLPRGQRREGQLATTYGSDNGYNYALVSYANPLDMHAVSRALGAVGLP